MNPGKKRPMLNRPILLFILIAVFSAMLTACAAVDIALREGEIAAQKENGTIQMGVSVEGIDIGGLTYSQAQLKMKEAEIIAAESLFIEVKLGDGSERLKAGEGFNVAFNTEDVLEQAILIGHVINAVLPDTEQQVQADKYALKLGNTIDTAPVKGKVKQWAEKYNRAPVDASATPLTKPDANTSKTGSSANAKAGQEGYFKYTGGRNGAVLKEEELVSALKAKLEARDFTPTDALFDTKPPGITIEQLKKITLPVASFTTKFQGSPLDRAGRVYNIAKAAGLINAKTILPAEEFSVNAALGARTEGGGWKLAPGIENGQYTDQAGGGVCQVSSTLFNAVLMADIDVKTMKRSHHSWPSSYVDIGRDATISTGAPDFRFTNNKTTPLYLFTTVDKNKKYITVEIYGEPLAQGMTIKITSKQLSSTPPNPRVEYQMDPSLPKGTIREARPAHNKKTSVTYREYWLNGKLVKRVQIFSDTYKAFPQLFLYAKGVDPHATPAPGKTPGPVPSKMPFPNPSL